MTVYDLFLFLQEHMVTKGELKEELGKVKNELRTEMHTTFATKEEMSFRFSEVMTRFDGVDKEIVEIKDWIRRVDIRTQEDVDAIARDVLFLRKYIMRVV